MEENRVTVYGKDAEDNQKRMFDWIKVGGKLYVETKDSHGHKIRTPASTVIERYRQIQKQQAG